jgi:hypothetical protein
VIPVFAAFIRLGPGCFFSGHFNDRSFGDFALIPLYVIP